MMQSRETGASIFSLITMSWLTPLILLGNRKSLEQSDIWNLHRSDKSKVIVEEWNSIEKGRIIRDIIVLNKGYFLLQYFCALISTVFSFSGPYFLYTIVNQIDRDVDNVLILPNIIFLFLCSIIQAIAESNTMYTGARASTRTRTVLIDQIYKKTIKRVVGEEGLGNVVGLMSVDADQTRRMCVQGFMIFLRLPLTIIIAVISLFAILGHSAFVGLFLIIAFIPLTGLLGKSIVRYKKRILFQMDKRVGIINEMLQGIRVVKFFAWEDLFSHKIELVRALELAAVVKWWTVRLIFRVIGGASGILISLFTLAVYTLWFGRTLDAAVAFTSMNLLNTISNLLGQVPSRFTMVFNCIASVHRINEYMKSPELQKHTKESHLMDVEKNTDMIKFENASFKYPGIENGFTLRNLNVSFAPGKLHLILGAIGQGKSSIYLALLGEMSCISGKYWMPKNNHANLIDKELNLFQSVSYAAQTPWIMNASIRENILFGNPYNEEKYKKIISACALTSDLRTLKGGDLTEIGEKGYIFL
jgi:ABC-type multidrug transport system fused ATPase/permease subunit